MIFNDYVRRMHAYPDKYIKSDSKVTAKMLETNLNQKNGFI